MAMGRREARRLRTAVLALTVAAGTVFVHGRIEAAQHSESEFESRFVPRPELARVSALGFDAVVADYYWLQAVQIVGGTAGDPTEYASLLGSLIDVVTTLDPWVDHPYRFAAVWLSDSVESVRAGNRLLERGVAYHPESWRNRFLLGFNHFFYLQDDATAAQVLEDAMHLPDAPGYIRLLVARLRAQTDGLETAAAFLRTLAQRATDPYARAQYEATLDEIETERQARFLDLARREYQRRNGRDITEVEDLARGPRRLLPQLPPAHPVLKGWSWKLDEETGHIVSSYYGNRYQLHVHPLDRQRRERWRPQLEREAGGA